MPCVRHIQHMTATGQQDLYEVKRMAPTSEQHSNGLRTCLITCGVCYRNFHFLKNTGSMLGWGIRKWVFDGERIWNHTIY